VDILSLAEHICKKVTEVQRYCVERILVAHKLYDVSKYEVFVQSGYYGQEIGAVKLDGSVARECDKDIAKMLAMCGDRRRIAFVLELEYGYLLPVLKGKSFEICTVDKSELIFGQDDHYRRLDKDVVASYSDDEWRKYKHPRGICIRDGDRFRVIDGYHRCAAAKRKCKVFVAHD
jgi:hypothetical protein